LKLDKAKIQKMFKELDVTDAGEIDFGNLLNAAVHDYLVASDVRLYKAFRDLDENESGKIPINVLKQKMRELNPYGNIEMILQIIADVDSDNDGTIDYEEFLKALHPDFNAIPGHDDDSDDDDSDDDDTDDTDNNEEKVENINNNQLFINTESIDQNTIIKQGYMKKEGKMIKSWRKRWFVLQNSGKIRYYHNEHQDKNEPTGSFNCKHLTEFKCKSWSKSNKKRYGIKIYTPHRNWKFLLQNNAERSEWIKAFETVSEIKCSSPK